MNGMILLAAFAGEVPPAAGGGPARDTLLASGLTLRYAADGRELPPWVVDSVVTNLELGGRRGCLLVRFAPGGPRPAADLRRTCGGEGVLASWDSAGGRWRPARPIGPGMVLEVPLGAGGSARYETGADSIETVSGIPLRVVPTTVLTRDSAGRAVRRLRERFAPALGTATGGVFEVPDSAAPGGWRERQRFELIRIVRPPP